MRPTANGSQRVAGLSADEARELAQPLRAARAASHVVFARWVLVMTNFERALYGNPEADLDTTGGSSRRASSGLTPP